MSYHFPVYSVCTQLFVCTGRREGEGGRKREREREREGSTLSCVRVCVQWTTEFSNIHLVHSTQAHCVRPKEE